MTRAPARRADPRRGSVIIGVLAMLVLASFMIFRFVEEAVQELHYRGQIQEDPEMRAVAFSTMEVVLAVLHEFRTVDGKLVAPVQGWGDPLAYAEFQQPEGYELEVEFEDETGKIAISRLNEQNLPLLFEEMGIDFTEGARLTDTFLDWMDGDDLTRLNGAEVDQYDLYDPPYRAANRTIKSWEELRLIEGFNELFFEEDGSPNAYHRQFTGAISLHHDLKTNMNTADPLTVAWISRMEGFDPENMMEYLAGDDAIRGTADDRIFFNADNAYYRPAENANEGLGSLESRMLNIRIWCRRGVTEMLIEALVDTAETNTGENTQGFPFTVISVRENLKIG